jgi:hypothetical protein
MSDNDSYEEEYSYSSESEEYSYSSESEEDEEEDEEEAGDKLVQIEKQGRQWASKLIARSSEYNGWPATNVLGPSNTYPQYGDINTAWAPAKSSGTFEYLELEFTKYMIVSGIEIYETYHPGAVVKISLWRKNKWTVVYSGESQANKLPAQSRIFAPPLRKTQFATKRVRIDLDTRKSPSWSEIDAVQLIGEFVHAQEEVEAPKIDRKNILATKVRGIGLDLKKFLKHEETADIHLVFEDESGTKFTFPAHKFILAARSKVFRSLFYGGFEDVGKEFILENVRNTKVMDQFLNYLYTDTLEVSDDIILPLLALADQYDLIKLKLACGAFASDKITHENWSQILEFASLFNEKELLRDCIQYVGKFINELMDKKAFLKLNQDLFLSLLESDEFPLDELDIFNLVVEYIDVHKDDGIDKERLTQVVRYPIMDLLTLYKNIRCHPLVPVEKYIEALEFNIIPERFKDSELNQPRFRIRNNSVRFTWVPQHEDMRSKIISDHGGRTITKKGSNTWDLVLLSSIPFTKGIIYFEIELQVINSDHSGMAFGLTNDKNVHQSSYHTCYGISANGTLHNSISFGSTYKSFDNGDVVGTLINFNTNEISFYRNGILHCKSIVGPRGQELYAVVFLYYTNDRISLLTKQRHGMYQLINEINY